MSNNTVGRFAPTPSGRMHAGNLLCAMLSYLSCKQAGGEWILRIEDLDEERCHFGSNSEQLMQDLRLFGMQWDATPEYQSKRFDVYRQYVDVLHARGLIYPCYCSRAELHAATAPHGSDGQVYYDGRCRRRFLSGAAPRTDKTPAYRIMVPDCDILFRDGVQGEYRENLERECTDFVIQRADGVYAYQLAVVIDDALSRVTEVVRGRDLLSSTPRQIWLFETLGFTPPQYYHMPLLLAADGSRLSKRDRSCDVGGLLERMGSPERVIGSLAHAVGLIGRPEALTMQELISEFNWAKIPANDIKWEVP